MTRTPHRWQHVVPATAAVLVATALAGPAHASPPTTRTVEDATDTGAAYDISRVVLRAAPAADRPAVVVVRHARPVGFGDALDVWFDLDGDREPDLHLTGSSFSQFAVFETDSFDTDGREVSERDCVRLSMQGRRSRVTLFPACLDDPAAFAVAVRSSADGEATQDGEDWVPRAERFTRRVAAVA